MSRDRFVDFSALMEERSSSVSEDSSSQAEEVNSRDTVASDVANVPDMFRAPTKRQAQEVQRCRQANFENSAGISKK
ncbi:hypothetical protein DdX_00958 [Ditylenchus destructor]|uniref:Uncharacterized protein n=1 Tax=Ditylenchus destructor TaxID=166010 RepID=A0AAD4NFY6_9BILA|nr:hypothetical protein DdX_04589 [Ditylenchus destructor]KAI1728756.1 hypothetical protein DdX_00958 [Ditylenchus destructor]